VTPGAVRRVVHCTLPPELVHKPILHDLIRATNAVVNVRRANVDVESGVAWFLLELSGPADQVTHAEAWLAQQGVTVEPIDA
jgi:ABC-type methionine transport system ATPase subunit